MRNDITTPTANEQHSVNTEILSHRAWQLGASVLVQVGNEVRRGTVVDISVNQDQQIVYVVKAWINGKGFWPKATELELHKLQKYPLELQLDALEGAAQQAVEALRTAQNEHQLAVDALTAGSHELLRWYLARGDDE